MKKRLSKKRHIGEFAVLGIAVGVKFTNKIKCDNCFDEFWDIFLDSLESHDLYFGGVGDDGGIKGFIEVKESLKRNPNEKDLKNVDKILLKESCIKSYYLTPNVDLFYGYEDYEKEWNGMENMNDTQQND